MEEEQIHLDAFEVYFTSRQNGKNKTDSVTGVASEFDRSKSTIFEWKKNFNWDDKEAIRATEINQNIQQNTNSTIIDNKTKYLSFYHKLLDDLKNNFNIKIENVRDLKLVMDGALILQGEITNIQQIQGKIEGRYSVTMSLICSDEHIEHEKRVLNDVGKAQGITD